MKIRKVMNINAVRVLKGSTISKAAEIAAFTSASDLCVVDEDNHFEGVLSEGDLMRAALPNFAELTDEGRNLDRDEVYELFNEKGHQLSNEPIDALVIRNPITVGPDDDVQKAAALMSAKAIRRLPVIGNGKLLGSISRADVCRAVFK